MKKTISIVLSEEVLKMAKDDSSIFGGNVSAYLAYLVLTAHEKKMASLFNVKGNDNVANTLQITGSNLGKNVTIKSKTKK